MGNTKPKPARPTRRGKRVVSVLGELQKGDRIMVSYHKSNENHELPVYSLVSQGGEVPEHTFRALQPVLRPCQDGLLAEATQTYELKPQENQP